MLGGVVNANALAKRNEGDEAEGEKEGELVFGRFMNGPSTPQGQVIHTCVVSVSQSFKQSAGNSSDGSPMRPEPSPSQKRNLSTASEVLGAAQVPIKVPEPKKLNTKVNTKQMVRILSCLIWNFLCASRVIGTIYLRDVKYQLDLII